MSEYITKNELEEFKKELIQELKNTELELKEKTSGQLLKPVYNKWFHDTKNAYQKNSKKPFRQKLPVTYVWKTWDAIRSLVCSVCSSKTVAGIQNTSLALDFCEKLCEFVDSYLEKIEQGNGI